MSKINLYLIEYAINALLRQKSKNIFIFIVFTLLISLVTSVFFIANSIKYELNSTVDKLPSITVQQLSAGKVTDIQTHIADDIISIAGVDDVV
ncbi:MAG: ABC transporter permease, partial [Campylobacterota bacterium]|nr:ABC transporter permease [Campylobacterota bacterium]